MKYADGRYSNEPVSIAEDVNAQFPWFVCGSLLSEFFCFFGDYDFAGTVISLRKGSTLPVADIISLDADWKFKLGVLNIQDPFEMSHNVAGNLNEKTALRLQRQCKEGAKYCRSLQYQRKSSKGKTWGLTRLLQSSGSAEASPALSPAAEMTPLGLEITFPFKASVLSEACRKQLCDARNIQGMWWHKVHAGLQFVLKDVLQCHFTETAHIDESDSNATEPVVTYSPTLVTGNLGMETRKSSDILLDVTDPLTARLQDPDQVPSNLINCHTSTCLNPKMVPVEKTNHETDSNQILTDVAESQSATSFNCHLISVEVKDSPTNMFLSPCPITDVMTYSRNTELVESCPLLTNASDVQNCLTISQSTKSPDPHDSLVQIANFPIVGFQKPAKRARFTEGIEPENKKTNPTYVLLPHPHRIERTKHLSEEVDCEMAATKRQRLDDQQNQEKELSWHCDLRNRVWLGRRKMRRQLRKGEPNSPAFDASLEIDNLETEARVTEAIVKQEGKYDPAGPLFSFIVTLRGSGACHDSRASAHFMPVLDTHHLFHDFFHFLEISLPRMVEKYIAKMH